MIYTREQLEAMTDDQLCAAVKQVTGLDVTADGNGMLAVMEWLEGAGWLWRLASRDKKRLSARAYVFKSETDTPAGVADDGYPPRALFIAVMLAKQEVK